MRNIVKVLMLVGMSLVGLAAMAVEVPVKPHPYTYATYFYCDNARLARATELIDQNFAPIYDQAVKDGVISAWGWGSHHTGGEWSRVIYHQNPSVEDAVAATDELQKRFKAAGGESGTEFGSICSRHTDYVWLGVAGGGDTRGKAGLSVYYECDIGSEERADALMKNVYAPVFAKHLGEGRLSTWGWSSHILGGKYRRLATTTADDFATLLRERGKILEEMRDNPMADDFSHICSSHADYLWRLSDGG